MRERKGDGGKYEPGIPRKSDGSLFFLLQMISKMRPISEGGSRIGIVFNGSPLFTGSAGSGESNIRKWIIEHDMLETIIALPDQLFYNTGIVTYIWIVTNKKESKRKGKVQLINAISFNEKEKISFGQKRKKINDTQIDRIVSIYENYIENDFCKIFENSEFGYTRITVNRPLRLNFQISQTRLEKLKNHSEFLKLPKFPIKPKEPTQKDVMKVLESISEKQLFKDNQQFVHIIENAFKKANFKLNYKLLNAIEKSLAERDETVNPYLNNENKRVPDPEKKDNENVPFKENIENYFKREVIPYAPDAWFDNSDNKIGYEIPFVQYFHKYVRLRSQRNQYGDIFT